MDAENRSKNDPENRRQRRISRRRRRILSAAAKIFAEKGYSNTTTREIALEADMGESTLYNYFDSKRDILLTIAGELKEKMPSALQKAQTIGGNNAIIAMFESAMDISESMFPFVQTLIGESWVDEEILHTYVIAYLENIHQVIEAFIQDRIDAGEFREIDTGLAAQLVIGMYAGLLAPALRGLRPLPQLEKRRELVESIVDIILNGVLKRPVLEAE